MARPWDPEYAITPELVRTLVGTQFPALAGTDVEPLGEGWDNAAFLVGGTFVFRFPRRAVAAPLLELECRLLPAVAPLLPLSAPVPTFIGRPGAGFPWSFAGHRMLPGRTVVAAAPTESERARAARPLAELLSALHGVRPADVAPFGAGPDPIGRMDLARRAPVARERLERLVALALVRDAQPWLEVIEAAVAEYIARPPSPRPTLVHGDLWAGQILVDERARPTGVIDWGDAHLGDPAADLALAHGFLPPSAHTEFRVAYGEIDEATWMRARYRATEHSAVLAAYGREAGRPDVEREALGALARMRTCS